MSNERLVTVNCLGGVVDDNPLASGATTLTATELANLPAIGTGDYASIVLDPDGVANVPEVVYVTAHTASATTATIVRAREGTAAASHPLSTRWVLAPTVATFGKDVDRPWGGDTLAGGPFDEEFNRDGSPTTLPSGWSWVNQGTSTYREEFGAGVIVPQVSGTAGVETVRSITRAIPAAASWVATAQLVGSAPRINWVRAGICLRDSGASKVVTAGGARGSTTDPMWAFAAARWTANGATFSAGIGTATADLGTWHPYIRVRKNSATSWDFGYSLDGRAWTYNVLATDQSAFFTPDQIGLYCSLSGTIVGEFAFDWFRVR